MTFSVEKKWFAMSATYGRELKIKRILEELNIVCFVPMRPKESKQKNQREDTYIPAINNLIFVYTDKQTLFFSESCHYRNTPNCCIVSFLFL